MELSKSVEVGSGGRIELFFPELVPGQKVDVHVVAPEGATVMRPEFGRLKGQIKLSDDFDDPIPEFEDYQ